MRSVVNDEKVSVLLTRVLPVTVPSVTQAEPFPPLHGEVLQAPCSERLGVGRLESCRVVVLQRVHHDAVDRLLPIERDLQPVRVDIRRGTSTTGCPPCACPLVVHPYDARYPLSIDDADAVAPAVDRATLVEVLGGSAAAINCEIAVLVDAPFVLLPPNAATIE